MRSTVEIEKLGTPTVTIATNEFVSLAKSSALSFGMGSLPIVVAKHPFGGISPDQARSRADDVIQDVIKAATQAPPKSDQLSTQQPYPAKTLRVIGTVDDINDLFFKNGWSDGLPIVPPTPERVERMLKGTSHRPDEIVGIVPPRQGILTVELVAIHAVMAGAKPQFMPAILAAMEAILDPKHNWRAMTTTTHPTAPVIVFNGPIIDEIGLAYGTGALGGGFPANITIGRTINLIGDIVGGSKAPKDDKSTLGQPANIIAVVVGENEKANPWGTLATSLGYKAGESVVTVFGAGPIQNIEDHVSETGASLLITLAHSIASVGDNNVYGPDTEVLLMLGPEHAATLAADKWKLSDVQQFLYQEARIPYGIWRDRGLDTKRDDRPKWLEAARDDTMVPIVASPDLIKIAVVGGAGKHSMYASSFGRQTRMVSRSVDKWR